MSDSLANRLMNQLCIAAYGDKQRPRKSLEHCERYDHPSDRRGNWPCRGKEFPEMHWTLAEESSVQEPKVLRTSGYFICYK